VAIYGGAPACNNAMRIAKKVYAELGEAAPTNKEDAI
jgi:alkylhydroperoxidase/carboxymuconolactone decarboxylase family protein YurZ